MQEARLASSCQISEKALRNKMTNFNKNNSQNSRLCFFAIICCLFVAKKPQSAFAYNIFEPTITSQKVAVKNTTNQNFPYISGDFMLENRTDFASNVKSSDTTKPEQFNSFFYLESNDNLHLHSNWQIKTNWRIQPNATINNRLTNYPENYRKIFQEGRGWQLSSNAIILEEIKLQFSNEDLKLSLGKFDPQFGTAHFNTKRIGVLTKDFTEDYNLREKLGVSLVVPLSQNQLKLSLFTNDTTKLNSSALDIREVNIDKNIAGNNRRPNSFAISALGTNLFYNRNLSYNIGYRKQQIDSAPNTATENAITVNLEYVSKVLGEDVVYFAEVFKANNFMGEAERKALYGVMSILVKHQKWQFGSTKIFRNIESKLLQYDYHDYQNQFNIGYRINPEFTIDTTLAKVKERGIKGNLLAFNLRYFLSFQN